jgi:ribose/xylose/arabinose/galactoside ABC-type transport system permease subunit
VAGNVAVASNERSRAGALIGGLARSRELTLAGVIVVLSAIVAVRAPNFLSTDNLGPVTTFAAIIAIAAVGEALVILTKNIDLSVESTIGVVAFTVGLILKEQALPVPVAWACGVGLGLALGMCNGVIVAVLRVPSIVATLGTLSIFRGLCFVVANGHEINLNDLPDGYTNAASQDFFGVPLFVFLAIAIVGVAAIVLRYTVVGRLFYAVGSNAEAAATIGVRSRLTVFLAFALSGMLAGVAGVLWGINYGAIYANSASGQSLAVIAGVVVGGVSIAGGSGTVVGAALGALFLGLINNALILLGAPQEWLQLIYGAVILFAVSTDALIQLRTQRARARSRIR